MSRETVQEVQYQTQKPIVGSYQGTVLEHLKGSNSTWGVSPDDFMCRYRNPTCLSYPPPRKSQILIALPFNIYFTYDAISSSYRNISVQLMFNSIILYSVSLLRISRSSILNT